MRTFKTFLTVIGAVTILVLAANSAVYAATGGKFILGKTNKANKVSTLKRTTSGSALNLVTKSSSNAPMTVNGRGKVGNLNADLLDGYDSSAMVNRTTVFEKSVSAGAPTGGLGLTTTTIPAGQYLVSGSAWIYGPTSGSGVECSILGASTSNHGQWLWIPINANGFYTPTLSGVIKLSVAQTLTFGCTGPSFAYNTYFGAPLQLTVTPVSQPVAGAASRVAPTSGRVSPAAH